jgi:hypothetical protein
MVMSVSAVRGGPPAEVVAWFTYLQAALARDRRSAGLVIAVAIHPLAFAPARVFSAFADPETKARWFAAPPDKAQVIVREHDFRVGGREPPPLIRR